MIKLNDLTNIQQKCIEWYFLYQYCGFNDNDINVFNFYCNLFYNQKNIKLCDYVNNYLIEALTIIVDKYANTPTDIDIYEILNNELKRLKRIDKLNDLKNNI